MAKDLNGKDLPKGITQRKDGRYMGRFVHEGEAYCLYGKKVKEVEKAMNNLRYEVEHGIHGSAKRLILNQWFNEWLSVYKGQTVKESTKDYFKTYYDLYIREKLGGKELKNIKAVHIQKLINNMANDGYKANTFKKVRNILNNMFVVAVRNDLIVKNPCLGVTLPKTERTERRVLTADEQRRFMEYIHESKTWQRYETLFQVAFGTGMRIGELLALNWTDVDFKQSSISVNKTLYYSRENGEYEFIIQTPKTESSKRVIPAMNYVLTALKRQKKDQLQHKMLIGDKWQPSDTEGLNNLVFTTAWGKPMDRNAVNRTIQSVLNEYNKREQQQAKEENRQEKFIEHFSAHTTRHTFATRCFEQNIPPKVIQGFLGHATLAMTMDLYTHITQETSAEEIKKLEVVF